MKFELNLASTHRCKDTVDALFKASQDNSRLSAYEKTLLLDAYFIAKAMFDQTDTGKRIKAIEEFRNRKINPDKTRIKP